MRAPSSCRNLPRGGRAFSTRRAMKAVKATSPATNKIKRASTIRNGVIVSAPAERPTLKKPRVGHPRRRGSLRGYRFFGAGELQSTVIDAGVAEFEQVQSVVLVQPPGAFCALLGKNVHGALDIAGAEI